MAEMSKQHYLDAKRLKEMTAVAAAAEAGAAHPAATGRSMTPPPRFRYEGTPPASPHGAGGGVFSMVDTKPSRRHSRTSDSADLRDLTHGLTISTKREVPAGRSASASAAAGTPDATAAANAELTKLRAEHSQLQSATAALEQEIARLKGLVQRTEGLEQELQQLKESHAKEAKVAAATAAAGAAGGAAAAAAAAAELNALRDEHGRVRALAESLEEEVAQLREASAQLQESQQQLDELQSEHATVKAAFTATQQQLEKLRQQQLDSRSVRSGSEFMDADEDFEGSSQGGSPMPAYKLQIQVHQLERQLVEQVAKTQEEATKRQKMVRGVYGRGMRMVVQGTTPTGLRQLQKNRHPAALLRAGQAAQTVASYVLVFCPLFQTVVSDRAPACAHPTTVA
jgi:predicted nuclease with TOPRIM domain